MSFEMKMKFDGKIVQKAKAEEIDDFEPILNGLKEKFGTNKKKRGL